MIIPGPEKKASAKVRKPGGLRSARVREVLPVEGVVSAAEVDAKLGRARAAVAGMPAASIKFLMKIDAGLGVRLEAERARRGLRSRVETIRSLLEEALKP
jgi:hypothetical protein